MPIKCLNTMTNDWCIRGRISKLERVKTFSKRDGSGEGKILNIEIIDMYGTQIQATFFSEAVDKFLRILKEGNVYVWSKGNIRMANRKFTSIKNDYCIVFGMYANIKQTVDEGDIKTTSFDFMTLEKVK